MNEFTSSANRCLPLTTRFPSFVVEMFVPLLITVEVFLLASDPGAVFD